MFGNACRGVFGINVSKVGILSVRLSEAQGNAPYFCKERDGRTSTSCPAEPTGARLALKLQAPADNSTDVFDGPDF
jgi:hypothetical protein